MFWGFVKIWVSTFEKNCPKTVPKLSQTVFLDYYWGFRDFFKNWKMLGDKKVPEILDFLFGNFWVSKNPVFLGKCMGVIFF
jgi:hypothetical protein